MNWLDMPLKEFCDLPYDQVTAGCHITPDKLMCWDILRTAKLYKAIDQTVIPPSLQDWDIVQCLLLASIILIPVGVSYFHPKENTDLLSDLPTFGTGKTDAICLTLLILVVGAFALFCNLK
jgi:hypothetical protein